MRFGSSDTSVQNLKEKTFAADQHFKFLKYLLLVKVKQQQHRIKCEISPMKIDGDQNNGSADQTNGVGSVGSVLFYQILEHS